MAPTPPHRPDGSPGRRLRLRGALAALALTALVLVGAGCTGSPEPAATTAGATATASAGASDGGGAAGPSDDGGTSAADAPIGVTPPPQPPAVTDACTGEGMYRIPVGGGIDPALPERSGATLHLALTEVGTRDGSPAAHLTASVDEDEARTVQPAIIGDTFTVDLWTFSITSVCSDGVELDLID